MLAGSVKELDLCCCEELDLCYREELCVEEER